MGRLRQYPNPDAVWHSVEDIRAAIGKLKHARELLARAKAGKARRAVSRAIKSAEGAERHAERIYTTRYYEERRREGTA